MADGTLDPRAPRRFDAGALAALAALARVFAREAARKISGDGLAATCEGIQRAILRPRGDRPAARAGCSGTGPFTRE
jgi:hypothetical protein